MKQKRQEEPHNKRHQNAEILSSALQSTAINAQLDERTRGVLTERSKISVPDNVAGSGSLERLVDKARDYANKATAENTNKAYENDWAHFSSWCRRRGAEPLSGHLTPDPQLIGLYITECAAPQDGSTALAVSTIERRLSGLSWNYTQRSRVAQF